MTWSDISIDSWDAIIRKDPRELFQKQNDPSLNVRDEGRKKMEQDNSRGFDCKSIQRGRLGIIMC